MARRPPAPHPAARAGLSVRGPHAPDPETKKRRALLAPGVFMSGLRCARQDEQLQPVSF
ncbi:hypothetical protein CSE45_2736 [Citreicella sp. SE45]|nr:hypothetical protein CSE45_2736 [Citreicella sp. SE45]